MDGTGKRRENLRDEAELIAAAQHADSCTSIIAIDFTM